MSKWNEPPTALDFVIIWLIFTLAVGVLILWLPRS
jgi:hypothetical protein